MSQSFHFLQQLNNPVPSQNPLGRQKLSIKYKESLLHWLQAGMLAPVGVPPLRSNAEMQVCRLTAELDLRRERLRGQEKGAGLNWHLERTAELDHILDKARIDHFTVENGNRPLREVASEVLARVGWRVTGHATGLL